MKDKLIIELSIIVGGIIVTTALGQMHARRINAQNLDTIKHCIDAKLGNQTNTKKG